MGGKSSLLLLICVWAGGSRWAANRRALLGVAPRFGKAVAPLMAPWCAEEDVPTSANLNYYGSSGSCVRWHRDDEVLFGGQGESKLIVSVSVGFSALFRWKPRPSPDCGADSTWLHHGDLLVMGRRPRQSAPDSSCTTVASTQCKLRPFPLVQRPLRFLSCSPLTRF